MKFKRRICKGCGINYDRSCGFKNHCSANCRIENPKKKRKCSPQCPRDSLFTREVEFINGTKHIQQVCKVCRRTEYISRHFAPGQLKNENALMSDGIQTVAMQRKSLYGDNFYSKTEWIKLRYEAFVKYGKICALCGETKGALHVDHVKPRSKYPALELQISNLQILCKECNIGKGAWDETDWRI